jgi:hypothetical protein
MGRSDAGTYTPHERSETDRRAVSGEVVTTLSGKAVPEHGSGDAIGICSWGHDDGDDDVDCDEMCVIAQSSLHFISSAAGIPRRKALLCDEHLNARIAGVTLDLSIGGAHTRSEEFEEQRARRRGESDEADADDQEGAEP